MSGILDTAIWGKLIMVAAVVEPDAHNVAGLAVKHNSRGQARRGNQLPVGGVAAGEMESQGSVLLGQSAGDFVAPDAVKRLDAQSR
ncbi:MAG TPA: hypothetical protein VF086_13970 [Propionibacteriaceae bacterium]